MVIYIRCAENGRREEKPGGKNEKCGNIEQVIEKRTTIEEETSEN
ncbi:MAG TPA: hypothetical protein PLN92_06635 [Thermotogota bacterium]|nr:hypothetical protein [Thermotogota bacterium]